MSFLRFKLTRFSQNVITQIFMTIFERFYLIQNTILYSVSGFYANSKFKNKNSHFKIQILHARSYVLILRYIRNQQHFY